MKRFALLFLMPALLAGCSTHPVALSEARPVPADRVFAYHSSNSGDASASTLLVARDAGYKVKGCPMAFYVDGTLAAHLRAGEVVTLAVPAGNHVLGAGPAGKGMCSWNNEAAHRRETSVLAEAGGRTKIRLAITHEGVIQVTPTAF